MVVRNLTVDGTPENQPMQPLERLATVAEFDGQPIEQLRMRGQRSVAAEVIGRIDQAAAEMAVPNAVDDGAPSQHVARVGTPGGRGGTAFPFVVGIADFESVDQSSHAGRRTRTK